MKISDISVKSEGTVFCKSRFYSARDSLSGRSRYSFSQGVNKLIGEIDSGNWAISYLLSMYKYRPKDFVLLDQPEVTVNNKHIFIAELSEFSCYMDRLYPLFSTADSVKTQIRRGLNQSKLSCSYDDIKNLFFLDNERVEQPLSGVGNEIFRSMAAIGFSYEKEIFCFPWFSNSRFEYYHKNLTSLLQILENLRKTVIIPIGIPPTS
jgi:hypothetical protein